MKLALSNVAFVLFIRIADLVANVTGGDTKDENFIGKEQSVVKNFKFASFNLLYIAIKSALLPIREWDHAMSGNFLRNALQNVVMSNCASMFPQDC